MVSKIYYFSGTGNCLAVSQKINEKLSEKSDIISIPTLEGKQFIEADRIGFVFPVYYHKVPDIVKRFILNAEFIKFPYIYAVATQAGETGQSLFDVQKFLMKKGQSLSLGIAIDMPGNAIETKPNDEVKCLSALEQKAIEIAGFIELQKNGFIDGNNGLLESIRNSIVKYISYNFVFAPKRYKINSSCNGCGICEKICPINNIHLVNHKPEWKKKCTNCLACFHWCPKEAIYLNIGKLGKRRKYHHPDISIKDMLKRN